MGASAVSKVASQTRTQIPTTVSTAPGILQRKCACGNQTLAGGECAACSNKRTKLQRRAVDNQGQAAEVPPIVHEVLRSSGQPLDPATRAFMEPRFGHDFGQVRVHTDTRAAESARAVNAQAYTVGQHVVFGQGQYVPQGAGGKQLLAHEMAHVVQQRTLRSPAERELRIGPSDDVYEREAHERASSIGQAAPPGESGIRPLGQTSAHAIDTIQRFPLGLLIGLGVALAVGLGALISHFAGRRGSSSSDKIQLVSGRYVGNVEGSLNNLKEDVLTVMDRLHLLLAMPNGDYAAEYATINKLVNGTPVPRNRIPKTVAAISRLSDAVLNSLVAQTILDLTLTANVGRGQPNKRDDILALQDALHGDWSLSNADYASERTSVNGLATPVVPDSRIPKTIDGIAKMKTAFVSGAIRRDLFAGTQAVTETQHANIEHVLNPTTVLVPPPPPPVGGPPPPPPAVLDPPPMTGTGLGGAFETKMLTMLNNNVGGWGTAFRALRAEPGQPAFPVPSANRIADAAQGEAERYFSPYIRVASRGIADKYHPGVYSLTAKLGDQSTRPLTDADRRGWMEYWMTLRAPNCRVAPCGQSILDADNYLGSRDKGELRRVRDLYMSTAAHVTDIDDAIHGWGAEAGTGTVFIQPFQRIPDENTKRTNRWELFTTLIHEFMHILMHPNFAAAADRIGGTARKILVEGFAEVMRTELWSGAGRLRSRLPSPEMAPLREQVEGKKYDYKDSVVKDSSYYDQLSDAAKIDSEVGHENARAAFFLGHVELLGLGAGTRTEGGPLAGVAMFEPTDRADAQVLIAAAGDTYASLLTRSGALPGGLLDDTTGAPLAAGAAIAPGSRVRIPGIRWVRALVNDTLGTVAKQHHVTVAALAAANGFVPAAPATTPLIVGKRILIPIHHNLP